MRFSEAWAILEAGGHIRRKSWDRGFYWYRYGEQVLQFCPGEPDLIRVSQVGDEDLLATDWEDA